MKLILKSDGTWIAGAVDMAGVMGGSDNGCLAQAQFFFIGHNTTGCQNVAGLEE